MAVGFRFGPGGCCECPPILPDCELVIKGFINRNGEFVELNPYYQDYADFKSGIGRQPENRPYVWGTFGTVYPVPSGIIGSRHMYIAGATTDSPYLTSTQPTQKDYWVNYRFLVRSWSWVTDSQTNSFNMGWHYVSDARDSNGQYSSAFPLHRAAESSGNLDIFREVVGTELQTANIFTIGSDGLLHLTVSSLRYYEIYVVPFNEDMDPCEYYRGMHVDITKQYGNDETPLTDTYSGYDKPYYRYSRYFKNAEDCYQNVLQPGEYTTFEDCGLTLGEVIPASELFDWVTSFSPENPSNDGDVIIAYLWDLAGVGSSGIARSIIGYIDWGNNSSIVCNGQDFLNTETQIYGSDTFDNDSVSVGSSDKLPNRIIGRDHLSSGDGLSSSDRFAGTYYLWAYCIRGSDYLSGYDNYQPINQRNLPPFTSIMGTAHFDIAKIVLRKGSLTQTNYDPKSKGEPYQRYDRWYVQESAVFKYPIGIVSTVPTFQSSSERPSKNLPELPEGKKVVKFLWWANKDYVHFMNYSLNSSYLRGQKTTGIAPYTETGIYADPDQWKYGSRYTNEELQAMGYNICDKRVYGTDYRQISYDDKIYLMPALSMDDVEKLIPNNGYGWVTYNYNHPTDTPFNEFLIDRYNLTDVESYVEWTVYFMVLLGDL